MAKEANYVLGCTSNSIASRSREVITALMLIWYLVRLPVEDCAQSGALPHHKDMDKLH